MEKNEARQLVQNALEKHRGSDQPVEIVILDEYTREEDFGWVFFYQSKQYGETGDFRFALFGNAPFIVNKRDGSLHTTGTAQTIEHYIENYRRTGNPHGKRRRPGF